MLDIRAALSTVVLATALIVSFSTSVSSAALGEQRQVVRDPRTAPVERIERALAAAFAEARASQPLTTLEADRLRIQLHLARVEENLRSQTPEGLAPEQLRARRHHLELLHHYWTAGVFPRNTQHPGKRRPYFIDHEGRDCAAGRLVAQTGGRALAERIDRLFHNAYVPEMNDTELAAWAEESGLAIEELALIQPTYCMCGSATEQGTDGPYAPVCGSNGLTYWNQCAAELCGGVTIAHQGECEHEAPCELCGIGDRYAVVSECGQPGDGSEGVCGMTGGGDGIIAVNESLAERWLELQEAGCPDDTTYDDGWFPAVPVNESWEECVVQAGAGGGAGAPGGVAGGGGGGGISSGGVSSGGISSGGDDDAPGGLSGAAGDEGSAGQAEVDERGRSSAESDSGCSVSSQGTRSALPWVLGLMLALLGGARRRRGRRGGVGTLATNTNCSRVGKMRIGRFRAVLFSGVALAGGLFPETAQACGGGVTTEDAVLEIASQRVLISLRQDETTDIIVELAVPSADEEWGVLLPLASEPTIDPEAIDPDWAEELERETRVRFRGSRGDSQGCGCGADDAAGGDAVGSPAEIGESVDIGPVTAVSLTAETGEAIATWLSDNGFVVAEDDQSLIDEYSGPGNWFLAFKRSDQAPADEPSGVVVHFSLEGESRGYPLRISQMGAGPELAITLFFAAPKAVEPAPPFATLSLTALNPELASHDYAEAIRRASMVHDDQAFVLEGIYSSDAPVAGHPDWRDLLTDDVARLTDPDQTLTRLTAVMPREALTEDVVFQDSSRTRASLHRPRPLDASLLLVAAAVVALRRRRTAV